MCNPRLGALLAAVPRLRVSEMTASVMPERSEPPNLALKCNASAAFSQFSYTFTMDFQNFWLAQVADVAFGGLQLLETLVT